MHAKVFQIDEYVAQTRSAEDSNNNQTKRSVRSQNAASMIAKLLNSSNLGADTMISELLELPELSDESIYKFSRVAKATSQTSTNLLQPMNKNQLIKQGSMESLTEKKILISRLTSIYKNIKLNGK